jgi:hypothetical protein
VFTARYGMGLYIERCAIHLLKVKWVYDKPDLLAAAK